MNTTIHTDMKLNQTVHFRGANIESRDKDHYTPLLVAVAQGNKESVDALLNRDANVRVKDSSEKTAVYIAAEENCLNVIKVRVRLYFTCSSGSNKAFM